jgi:hypothetical protein
MPCRDDYAECEEQALQAERKRRLDLLTKEMCSLIEEDASIAHRSSELAKWWETHQMEDKARRAAEARTRAESRRVDEKRLVQLNAERAAIMSRLKRM